MVHLRLTCAVAFAVLMMVTSQSLAEDSNKLIGTWKLISAKYGGQESNLPKAATTLKHITPVQMIWLSYDSDGKMTRAGGGRYTLQGDEYTDTPEYGIGDFSVVKGQTHVFKCKIDGNKWYHDGKLANGLTIEEVWERVEK